MDLRINDGSPLMFDHDLPRAQVDRLDTMVDLLGRILDRLPERPTAAVPEGQVMLKEPAVPTSTAADPAPVQVTEPAAPKAPARKPPPRSGPGSNKDAWMVYARHADVDPTGMSRDDIVAALEKAGIPVE